MAPSNLKASRWTPTREEALKLVKAGKVRRIINVRGGDHISVAGVTLPRARVIAKAVLFLEEIGAVRQRPNGSAMEEVRPTPLDRTSIPELMMELHEVEVPHGKATP